MANVNITEEQAEAAKAQYMAYLKSWNNADDGSAAKKQLGGELIAMERVLDALGLGSLYENK